MYTVFLEHNNENDVHERHLVFLMMVSSSAVPFGRESSIQLKKKKTNPIVPVLLKCHFTFEKMPYLIWIWTRTALLVYLVYFFKCAVCVKWSHKTMYVHSLCVLNNSVQINFNGSCDFSLINHSFIVENSIRRLERTEHTL